MVSRSIPLEVVTWRPYLNLHFEHEHAKGGSARCQCVHSTFAQAIAAPTPPPPVYPVSYHTVQVSYCARESAYCPAVRPAVTCIR